MNKPAKDFLRRKFSDWYSSKVQQELAVGKSAAEVQVNMTMSVLKEASTTWISGLYDYLRSQPGIIKNGFVKAGIEEALAELATSPAS